ncbi:MULTISPECIES: fimbrial protein [unclassified Zymobacter]|uniref:fimbrial protein n=1 Tax=unclassified Zymobacter TaxID=3048685 RepID=UPI0039C0FC5C
MVLTHAIFRQTLALLIGTAALLPTAVQAAHKDLDPFQVQGLHGDVHFGGAIIAAPCRVSFDSLEQTVSMGEQNTSHFHRVGDETAPVSFVIRLQDCLHSHRVVNPYTMSHDTNTEGSLVRITFIGEGADPRAPELLGGTGLSGVGLRIMDSEGRLIPLGQSSDPLPLHFDNDTVPFKVSLQSYAPQQEIQLGRFHAMTTFRLSYQ